MNKIGVRLHDLGKGSAEALAKEAKDLGFQGVQLVLNKAIEGETGLPGTLNQDKCEKIAKAFSNQDLDIMMLGAYFNPVHSNKDLVATNIAKFKEHLRFAPTFNTKYVGSETGSYNDDKWTYNPLNRKEEAFQEVKRIFSSLADVAKEENANLAIEGAYGHCMYSPDMLHRLVQEIDNGHVFITVDVYNYLSIDNYTEQELIFDRCLELFSDKIMIFHMKDFIVTEDKKLVQVGLGHGLMNFRYYIPLIKKYCPNAFLIFEGVKKEDMKSSLNFIKKLVG